jgi:hypothetical protein
MALVLALLFSTVLMILLTALFGTRLIEMKAVTGTVRATYAQSLAEAGVDYTIGTLIRDEGEPPSPLPYDYGQQEHGDGTFHPVILENNEGVLEIESTGREPSGRTRTVEVLLETVRGNELIDEFAAFSCGNISIDGSSGVYDGSVYAGGNLTIGVTNAVQNGDAYSWGNIVFTGNGSIPGSATSSNGNVEVNDQSRSHLRVGGNAAAPDVKLYPNEVAAGVSEDPSDYDVPRYCEEPRKSEIEIHQTTFDEYEAEAEEDGSHLGNVHVTPSGEGGYFGQHYIGGNLTIDGTRPGFEFSGVYYVDGNMKVTGNYTGKATFVVKGNVEFEGNTSSSPADRADHGYIVGGNVIMRGNVTVDGIIYAKGNVESTGSSVVNGSVVALGNLGIIGAMEIHYRGPEKGLEVPNERVLDYSTLRWRLVSN